MRVARVTAVSIVVLLALLGGVRSRAQETPEDAPRILVIGLWDRAFQQMAKASAETRVPVRMRRIALGDTPGTVLSDMETLDYARFDLIYVLQIDQAEAHALAGLLGEAKKANPRLRVVQLDRRATQQELLDAGILEVDPRVTAYWRSFGLENLKRLLGYSRVKYLGAAGDVQAPLPTPAAGLYHPDAPGFFVSWADYSTWYRARQPRDERRPLVALFIQQDYVVYGNSRVYEALIRELERRGVGVAAMFGGTLDLQAFVREARPSLLMLQHHQGPEDAPGPGKKPFLEELGVPYLYCAGMVSGITVDEWREDVRGLKRGGYAQLARHELFGLVEPFILGARASSAYGVALDEPIPERIHRFVDRVKGWLRLAETPASEKKVAIVYFHKYLGKADVGRPAPEMSRYLDPHESLVRLLRALSVAGYKVDPLPSSSEELVSWMKTRGRNAPSWAPGELQDLVREGRPVLLSEKKYSQWYSRRLSASSRAAVERTHGPPPGKLMVVEQGGGKAIVLPCIRLGNVVLAPQPDRGSIQDRDLVHSRTVPPPHNYLAFYWWLEEELGAHAMVHFGAHGSEIYLPGKEVFLSGDCFPDVVVGSMPNFYVWSIQNIGEAIIAKRRSSSVIVDHLVPPIVPTASDERARKLLELVDDLRRATAPPVKAALAREVALVASSSGLAAELRLVPGKEETLSEAEVERVSNYLRHLDDGTVVQGMHVLGSPPPADEALRFAAHIVRRNTELEKKVRAAGVKTDPDELARRVLEELVERKATPAEAARKLGLPLRLVAEELADELALGRRVFEGLSRAGDELANLLSGLEGKLVPPGPGGDPILRPDALPTGRNLYGLSPAEIPTRPAWNLARRVTDEFLAAFKSQNGRYPEKLAFALTGMETFRDTGVMEAQVLHLLGVRPEWSPGGLVSGLSLVPRAELGRPRVDTVLSVGAIYLKSFPACVRLLDEAVRLAALADEPDNAVRRHALALERDLAGAGIDGRRARELAHARVFGSPPGDSSARLVWFLPRSGTWQDRKEVVDLWRTMRTHAYTGALWGEKLPELHDKVYAGTDAVLSSWSDNLLSPLTNHHYPEETGGLAMSVQWINGRKPDVSVFDLRRRADPGAIGLEDVLSLELRSVTFNREWIQGQMKHGYVGATQFMQVVDNAFQWESVRQGAIWPGAWEEMVSVYVRDSLGLGIRGWFDRSNPHAFQETTATLLEASRKGFWFPDPDTLRELAVAHADSVARFGASAGPYTGGNEKLRALVTGVLSRPEDERLRRAFLEKVDGSERAPKAEAPAKPAETEVKGRKLESVEPRAPVARAGATGGDGRLHAAVGIAVLVLLLIGFRLGLGAPPGV